MSQLTAETPTTTTDGAARTSAALDSPDRPEKLGLWHRLRQVVQEMNYATRRLVELQMRLP